MALDKILPPSLIMLMLTLHQWMVVCGSFTAFSSTWKPNLSFILLSNLVLNGPPFLPLFQSLVGYLLLRFPFLRPLPVSQVP
jgi:hypothetical protein